jgi:hypothetical protein
VSFSFHEPNDEEDGSKVQTFLAEMESAIRDHPLWANATSQEIDHALEVKKPCPTDPCFSPSLTSLGSRRDEVFCVLLGPGEVRHDQIVRPHVWDLH